MVFSKGTGLTVFDGAIGTEVQKKAPELSEGLTDLLNLSDPETVKKIHRAYLQAGAEFLTTNTFSSSEIRLSKSRYGEKYSEINEKGALLAKEAIHDLCGLEQGDRYVAGSIGPTGETLVPLGDYQFEQFYDAFYRQAKALKNGGADWLIIETMESLREAKAALSAAKQVDLPVISSMSYGDRGRTSFGVSPKAGAVTLDQLRADVLGINCGTGPRPYPDRIKTYHKFTNKPLLAEANAGNPTLEDGEAIYELTPEQYIEDIRPGLPYLTGVGSCCGSDPRFTRALAGITADYNMEPTTNPGEKKEFLTNNSSVILLSGSTELVEIRIGRGELKDIKTKTISGKINLLNLQGISDPNQELEDQLARQFLKLRNEEPIGIKTGDPETLKVFLQAYPGIAPVRITQNEASLKTICEQYGGLPV